MPKLSIITINFNNASGLEKTIQSVISQKFGDFEYIIIDGRSSDESVQVIQKYVLGISNWISEPDKGIYNAMNKGIAKASGEYCLFLNSGDYLCNDTVLNKVFTQNTTADIIYGDMMIDSGKEKPGYGEQPDILTDAFLIHTTLWHPVSFIKRKLFETYGMYSEDYKIISDYEFFLRTIIGAKVSTKHVKYAISVFNTFGIGSNPENQALHDSERKIVQEKYFEKNRIEEVNIFYSKQKEKAMAQSDWFKRHPMIKKVVKFFIKSK